MENPTIKEISEGLRQKEFELIKNENKSNILKYFYGFESFFVKYKAGTYTPEQCVIEFNNLYGQNISAVEFKELANGLSYSDVKYKNK